MSAILRLFCFRFCCSCIISCSRRCKLSVFFSFNVSDYFLRGFSSYHTREWIAIILIAFKFLDLKALCVRTVTTVSFCYFVQHIPLSTIRVLFPQYTRAQQTRACQTLFFFLSPLHRCIFFCCSFTLSVLLVFHFGFVHI